MHFHCYGDSESAYAAVATCEHRQASQEGENLHNTKTLEEKDSFFSLNKQELEEF